MDWSPQMWSGFGRRRRHRVGPDDPLVLAQAMRQWAPGEPWSVVKRMIRGRRVAVNGALCLHDGRTLLPGQWVDVFEGPLPPPPTASDLRVVHCDRDLVIVEKPPRMLTLRHRAEARWPAKKKRLQPTLEEALSETLGRGGRDAPLFSVHRIDRDTSGLLAFARTESAQQALIRQFAAHEVVRTYRVVCLGELAPQTVESRLVRDRGDGLRGSADDHNGMPATTHLKPKATLRAHAEAPESYQELECSLETGRTHQIRIHLAESGAPVCGDWVYRGKADQPPIPDHSDAPRLALHASVLALEHPTTRTVLRFESPWPPDLHRWIARLQGAPQPKSRKRKTNAQD